MGKYFQTASADFFLAQHRLLASGLLQQPSHKRPSRRGPKKVNPKRQRHCPWSQTKRAIRRREKQAALGIHGQEGVITSWKLFWAKERRRVKELATAEERLEIQRKYRRLSAEAPRSLKGKAKAETHRRRTLKDPAVAAVVEASRRLSNLDHAIVPYDSGEGPRRHDMLVLVGTLSQQLVSLKEATLARNKAAKRDEVGWQAPLSRSPPTWARPGNPRLSLLIWPPPISGTPMCRQTNALIWMP
jgi:hypothetical protein